MRGGENDEKEHLSPDPQSQRLGDIGLRNLAYFYREVILGLLAVRFFLARFLKFVITLKFGVAE